MMVKYTDSTLNTACPEVDGSKFLLSSLKNNTALFKGAESEDERYVELFCFFFFSQWPTLASQAIIFRCLLKRVMYLVF